MAKKIIYIVVGVILVCLAAAGGIFGAKYFIDKQNSNVATSVQSDKSLGNNLATSTKDSQNPAVDKCEVLYQDFLTQSGSDYTDCFKDFNFSTSTCGGTGANDKNTNVLVILDSSGSMAGIVDGQRKIDIAKEAINRFLTSLPTNTKIGLMVYGHKGSNTEVDKATSCGSIDLVYPLSADKTGLSASLTNFDATGWTPIADSLKKAEGVFTGLDATKNNNYVYIVSDGVETCGGNPVSMAKEINTSGIKAIVNVIGFNVDSNSANNLRSIATAGAGSFYLANTTSELNKIINESADYLRKASCRSTQYLSATSQNSNAYLSMTSCVSTVYLRESSAYSRLFLDTTSILSGLSMKNISTVDRGFCSRLEIAKCNECLNYINDKQSARHKKMQDGADLITKNNDAKMQEINDFLNSIK